MSWTFWVGTVVITATVCWLIWLSGHPSTSTDRRPVGTVDRTSLRILLAILRDQRAGYRRSAAALRRRVNMTTTEFYALTDRLVRRGLIRVVQVQTFGQEVIRFNGYQLTSLGLRLTRGESVVD